ncbi:MAG: Flp pilus assembly complex ATPase component TadA [Alphaproteobacteria bacterium]|nr:Flp pilus assembly complex ATPase component TadA [Alphaproteobacteria bacterium]
MTNIVTNKTAPIHTILAPLAHYYNDEKTVELRMTRPQQVIVERRGSGKEEFEAPKLTLSVIEDICKSLGNLSGTKFHPDDNPKVSCILPDIKHRFECLVGSSVQTGLSMAIRCKHPFEPSWKQVGANEQVVEYIKNAVETEKHIIISGATNTGKTTLLNKMLQFLPNNRRVIAAEDTPELEISRFWDGVGLLASREEATTSGMVGWREIYDHCMRITPDHIIFGEISTQNSFGALAALNSGITGFMCTIHAESAEQAITRKFEQNIAWSGQNMPRVSEFLAELVDLVIQIRRSTDGFRRITEIYEPKTNRYIFRNGNFTEASC